MSLFTIGTVLFALASFVCAMALTYQTGKTNGEKKPLIILAAAVVPLVAFCVVGAVVNDCAKDPAALAWYYDNMSIDAMNANVDKALLARLHGDCYTDADCDLDEACKDEWGCVQKKH